MVDINNEKDSVITSNGQSLACVIFALDSLAKDGGVTVQAEHAKPIPMCV